MKNDKFPSTNMVVDTIQTYLSENMFPLFLKDGRLQLNLMGELINNGYDVLKNFPIEEGEQVDLIVRLSDGFMPIKIKSNPQSSNSIARTLDGLIEICNTYKDVRNAYLICLFPSNQEIIDKNSKLLHSTNEEDIVWWGGRVLQEDDSARNQVEPIWIREKLKLYGLKKQVISE